jgi:large subunit ribosomal protein L21
VFAIIQSGGRQVKVTPGAVVEVDRIDAQPGEEVSIDQVLFLEKDGGEVLAGAPFVANVKVLGVVDGESRGRFASSRRSGARACAGRRAIAARSRACGSRTSSFSVYPASPWQQKRDRAVHGTGATATRSASASSASTATW